MRKFVNVYRDRKGNLRTQATIVPSGELEKLIHAFQFYVRTEDGAVACDDWDDLQSVVSPMTDAQVA